MSKLCLSRRSLIAAIAGLSGAGALHRLPSAAAQAPVTGGQAPFFYRFKIGDVTGTVVSDGSVGPLGKAADLYANAPKGNSTSFWPMPLWRSRSFSIRTCWS